MVGDLTHGSTVSDDEDPSFAHADAERVEFADDAMNRGSGHGIKIQKTKRLASVKSQSSGSVSACAAFGASENMSICAVSRFTRSIPAAK